MSVTRKNAISRTRLPLVRTLLAQAGAVTGSWAIISGGDTFRILALGTTTIVLVLPFIISLEAGLLAVVSFEPFRGLLRRAQYLIVPYSETEPIHLITPIVTIIGFLFILFRNKLSMLWATPLSRPVFLLAVICFIQIFNPIQGSLFVGFSGGLFYLVPMAWFYFGQTVQFDFFERVFKFVVVLALISSLYGLYQIYIGYPEFELYWLENTDNYDSINVYDVTRALATFNNAEEWGRYVQIGCICGFGFAMSASSVRGRYLWLASGIALMGMLALTGQRSSIFGLFLALAILVITGVRSIGSALARIGLISLPLIIIFGFVTALSDDDIYDIDESQRAAKILSHTAKGTVNPAGEGSLDARFETWTTVVTEILPANPIGYGLGRITLSAGRESSKMTEAAIDNYVLCLAISAGVPAALLFLWILFRASLITTRKWKSVDPSSKEAVYFRISLALLSTFLLNNIFGTSFVIYSIAPLGWFLIGWVGKGQLRTESGKRKVEN